ncbi:MAG TPA: 4Fe-4S dicluster domain-containing protein [Bacteroidota bacterium]|nr:4Fe-4S dicluster domain-containing protein [Bacteroidota bacterium]
MYSLEEHAIGQMISSLKRQDYTVIGPTVQHGVIVYDEIHSLKDLPAGYTDDQKPGHYRLSHSDKPFKFQFNSSPHAWKKFLRPSVTRLWHAELGTAGFEFAEEKKEPPRFAFLGVRPCDLQAIRILDNVLLNGNFTEEGYKARREKLFIIVVNCTEPGGTCFCSSMGTGPRAVKDFDLAITEIPDIKHHRFMVEIGSEQGETLIRGIQHGKALPADVEKVDKLFGSAVRKMGRSVKTGGIAELLKKNFEHRRWEEVGNRCLSCTNCTMVCPTCFCTTIEDTTDLSGKSAERWRKWDSCFTLDFSYIHGGSVRSSVMARYRQWLVHKFSAWKDQFGTLGCVGCGRCITWCPVGIDITEELRYLREEDHETPSIKKPAKGKNNGKS